MMRMICTAALIVLFAATATTAQGYYKRVIGGAPISDYAASGYLSGPTGTCSGTLIGCDTFLTAAHCVCDGTNAGDCAGRDPRGYRVFFQHAGWFQVSSIAVDPDFSFMTPAYFLNRGDVAILKLAVPVYGISPMPVRNSSRLGLGAPINLVGWGYGYYANQGGTTGIKRGGTATTTVCSPGANPTAAQCWIGSPNETCQGDSGGTIANEGKVVGVTSGGAVGCPIGGHGFASDVVVEEGFINQETGPGLGVSMCGLGSNVAATHLSGDDPGVFGFTQAIPANAAYVVHQLAVPSGKELMRVGLNFARKATSRAELDVYIRRGAPPTRSQYDFKATGYGFDFQEISSPLAGTWYFMVDNVGRVATEYQLVVTLFTDSPNPVCSDGVVQFPEECEPTNDVACPGLCTSSCRCNVPGAIHVTKTVDDNGSCTSWDCSLREAVMKANATPGKDTIVVPAGYYPYTIGIGTCAGDPGASVGDLNITDDLDLLGAGQDATVIDANDLTVTGCRVMSIAAGKNVKIRGVQMRNGSQGIQTSGNLRLERCSVTDNNLTSYQGGGILTLGTANLVVSESKITNNKTTRDGGGIAHKSSGSLRIIDSDVSFNSAGSGGSGGTGGGVWIEQGTTVEVTRTRVHHNSTCGSGGGLWVSGGATTVSFAEFSSNHSNCPQDGPGAGTGNGGGLGNENGVLTIYNSTISDNVASLNGGGVWSSGQTSVENCTIYGNFALRGAGWKGGGLDAVTTGPTPTVVNVKRTILGGNSPADCDVSGANIVSLGFNSYGNNCTSFVQVGDIPYSASTRLDASLRSNGGKTFTHALLAGSDAIDSGGACLDPLDQRGVGRPRIGRSGQPLCDIGAVEAEATEGVASSVSRARAGCGPLGCGVATTDIEADGTSLTDVIETTVESPNAGMVSIEEVLRDRSTRAVEVSTIAPAATVGSPLRYSLMLDQSLFVQTDDAASVVIAADGSPLGNCSGASGVASPDPCVESRSFDVDRNLHVIVLASVAHDFTIEDQSSPLVTGCPAIPKATDCREVGSGTLVIANHSKDSRDSFKFKWRSGDKTVLGDFDDPRLRDYALCVYDATQLRLHYDIPADGQRWIERSSGGFQYTDRRAARDGITKVILAEKPLGVGKISISGKGDQLPDDTVVIFEAPVVAQLINVQTGQCWQATFSELKRNLGGGALTARVVNRSVAASLEPQ